MENKTNPTATSFRQSLKLIQAGTPTDNADFVWVTTDAVPLEPILELKNLLKNDTITLIGNLH